MIWMRQASHSNASHRLGSPDDIFQLRITLLDIEPMIWRRVLVSQDLTLPRLHSVFQTVMGWTNAHLHQFTVGDLRFGDPDPDFEPGPIDYRRITLNQIAPHRGSTCVYEYDFGDSWDHLIEVEEELPVETVAGQIPLCLAGERACPPEDCGGPGGYARFLEAIRDQQHPEHDGYREWAGGDFDPDAFNFERVNQALARLMTRSRSAPTRPRAPRPPRA